MIGRTVDRHTESPNLKFIEQDLSTFNEGIQPLGVGVLTHVKVQY